MTKFKDVAHLYKGCQLYSKATGEMVGTLEGVVCNKAHFRVSGVWASADISYYKPAIRPLDSMTEEEVLTICKLACESVYGDYRFSKWSVERSPHELCHWDVNNKRSLYSFTVSSIDGDVLLYDGEDIDPVYIDSNYRFWYLKQGFDLFSLIPNGEAIDKTKI